MHVVITTVQIKPGSIDAVRELFERTNPGLVADQADWVEAKFAANHETNTVTVMAFWKDPDSYREFSSGNRFRTTMAQFGQYFESAPQVSINEVLFEM